MFRHSRVTWTPTSLLAAHSHASTSNHICATCSLKLGRSVPTRSRVLSRTQQQRTKSTTSSIAQRFSRTSLGRDRGEVTLRRHLLGRSFHETPQILSLKQAQTTNSGDDELFRNNFIPRNKKKLAEEKKESGARHQLQQWEENRVKDLGGDLSDLSTFYSRPDEQRQLVVSDEVGIEAPDEGIEEALEDPENLYPAEAYLRPGTLVAIVRPGEAEGTLAIYVRAWQTQLQFYTIRGKWYVSKTFRDIVFPVPDFVPKDLIDPLLPFMPTSIIESADMSTQLLDGSIPREVGAPVVNRLAQFLQEAKSVYRKNATTLDNIYDIMARESEDFYATLEEIAAKVLGLEESDLTDTQRYAVHLALERQKFPMTRIGFEFSTRFYLIRSKSLLRRLDQVCHWVRQHQEVSASSTTKERKVKRADTPLERFIQKARSLIITSRRIRSPTTMGGVGPSSERYKATRTESVVQKKPGPAFTPEEEMIIEYLVLYATSPAILEGGSLSAVGPVLLRAIGMYEELTLDAKTALLALQELGVVFPWTNRVLFQEAAALPGHGIHSEADKVHAEMLTLEHDLNPNSFTDSMQHLRKDWGDLPVFCVDAESAHEIDDGFSLEPVPGADDRYWVHVHVANPSAFIPPDHPLAKVAYSAVRTVYIPDKVYHMFPPRLAHDFFGLERDRPCLTFSALVSLEGALLETQITPGIIRNVISLTPTTVRNLLGVNLGEMTSLTVGGTLRAPPKQDRFVEPAQVPQAHRDTLQTLATIAAARRKVRHGEDTNMVPLEYDQEVVVQGAGHFDTSSYRQPSHYLGDPIISVRALNGDPHATFDTTKGELVGHVMILAGEVAARWCRERNIPILYSGTMHHPEFPKMTREEMVKADDRDKLRLPRSFLSPEPVPHDFLSMEQYAKCTSPLRRYGDLMVHWQVEAALRQQAETGPRPVDGARLPFSSADLERIRPHIVFKDTRRALAYRRSEQAWMGMFLFRAFYFREAPLPTTFPCLVLGNAHYRGQKDITHRGELLPFRFSAFLTQSPEGYEQEAEAGDIIPVKLTYVDLFLQQTRIVATGPPNKPPKGTLTARASRI